MGNNQFISISRDMTLRIVDVAHSQYYICALVRPKILQRLLTSLEIFERKSNVLNMFYIHRIYDKIIQNYTTTLTFYKVFGLLYKIWNNVKYQHKTQQKICDVFCEYPAYGGAKRTGSYYVLCAQPFLLSASDAG